MRLVRILLASLLVLIVIAGTVTALVFHNKEALVGVILQRIDASTGYDIVPSSVHVRFSDHLLISLEAPRVYQNRQEIAHLDNILAIVSYHSILKNNGLPLRELRLDHPVGQVPARTAAEANYTIPRPDVAGVRSLLRVLDAIGTFASSISIYDATLTDPSRQTIIDHFDLVAAREHRFESTSPWRVRFDGTWRYPPLNQVRMSGTAHLETARQAATGVLWSGEVWFWDFDLAHLVGIPQMSATGAMQGALRLVVNQNGTVEGRERAEISKAVISGPAFTHPISLGSFALSTEYGLSEQSLRLANILITQGQKPALAASFTVANPYDPARTASIEISGIKIALSRLSSDLAAIRAVPASVLDFTRGISGGSLAIEQAILAPREPIKDWTVATVSDNLKFGAIVSDAGLALTVPPVPNLPPIRHLEAGVSYDRSAVRITQGSAAIGQSSFSGLDLEARIPKGRRPLPYHLRFKGTLDFAEFHLLAAPLIKQLTPRLGDRIESIGGNGALQAELSGALRDLKWSPPHDYSVTLAPNDIDFSLKGIRQHFALVSGTIEAHPGQIRIGHLFAASPSNEGHILVDGTVFTGSGTPAMRNLTIEIDDLKAERWVPLLVASDDLAVDGDIGGKLIANSPASGSGTPVVTGVVTVTNGKVQLGFVRSPMIVTSGSLTLDGKGLVFDLPHATLEGHAIDFKVTLADFAHPELRIDTKATALDFEVLRFIRLPWSPKTPVNFFPLPVTGHVEAQHANFDRLQLTNVSTDFSRAHEHWHVTNFKATTLDGNVALDLSGRSADEWIHARGSASGIDTRAIFTLVRMARPPMSGTLTASFDIWGNTDTNFFQTLAGNLSVEATHGIINRLTLLTRILSLINLKTWLTAHLPDPRIAGVPFDSIMADFKGKNGNMYTDDFHLNGPVLVMTAKGNIDLGGDTLNMEVSVVPFQTYNWLLTKIPLVGTHLAGGTHDLVAAYFQVYGPLADPKVAPKPITSVAAFVTRMLSLPINIIRPNTIKP